MKLKLNKKYLIWTVSVILIIFIVIFFNNRQYDHFPTTLGEYINTGFIKFNSETIISELDQGKTNVFTTISNTTNYEDPPFSNNDSSRTQAYYLRVASEAFEFIWNESIQDWNLYYLSLSRECKDEPSGFDTAELILFKLDKSEYLLRELNISSVYGEIAWGGGNQFSRPLFEQWDNLDLARYTISADQVLQIAENNGGRDDRLIDQNNCDILIRIPHSKQDLRWEAIYYSSPYFSILIDPYSGEYEQAKTQ